MEPSDIDKLPVSSRAYSMATVLHASKTTKSRFELLQVARAAVIILKDFYQDRNALLGAIECLDEIFNEDLGVETSLVEFSKIVIANAKMELAQLDHLFSILHEEVTDGN